MMSAEATLSACRAAEASAAGGVRTSGAKRASEAFLRPFSALCD